MASFLDNLAASWGSGYNVDEYARRRAMNDALMNLGTTLMMAGGSGSWRAAAPMLAQAIPSAYGAFKGSVGEAQQLAERQAEKEWQEKQRAFIEEERERLANERADAKKQEELMRQAADKRAEMLESQINTDYEKALEDPDITDKTQAEQYWNTARTALESYYLTKDPAMLAPLEKVMGGFKSEIEYTENLNKEIEEAAKKAGFQSAAQRTELMEAEKQARIESARAAAEARREAERRRAEEEQARLEYQGLVSSGRANEATVDANTGMIVLPSGKMLPASPQAFRAGQDANVKKELFNTSVGMLQPLWGQSKAPGEVQRFSAVKQAALSGSINPAKYNQLTREQEVVERVATALGVPPPTTPEEVKALFTLASNPQAAYTHIQSRVFGQTANNPTTSGVAAFAEGGMSQEANERAALDGRRQAAYDAVRKVGGSHADAMAAAQAIR